MNIPKFVKITTHLVGVAMAHSRHNLAQISINYAGFKRQVDGDVFVQSLTFNDVSRPPFPQHTLL